MFRTSLRSSKVYNEIHKPVCKLYAFDWLLLLQGLCLQIGFPANFGTFVVNVSSNRLQTLGTTGLKLEYIYILKNIY
jgi:hypothetical protein